MTTKLHIGCGRTILKGWVNLDIMPLEGVDIISDLNQCKTTPLPFEENSVDEFLASHVLEHIERPLDVMEELHRIANQVQRCCVRFRMDRVTMHLKIPHIANTSF